MLYTCAFCKTVQICMHPHIIIHTKCITAIFSLTVTTRVHSFMLWTFHHLWNLSGRPSIYHQQCSECFVSSLFATIIEQTPLYARQVLGDEADTKWANVTSEDIWAFFGFALVMGINRLPQIQWSTQPEYHYGPIADRITRDRFLAILRFMHFRDNTMQPSSSPPIPIVTACGRSDQL